MIRAPTLWAPVWLQDCTCSVAVATLQHQITLTWALVFLTERLQTRLSSTASTGNNTQLQESITELTGLRMVGEHIHGHFELVIFASSQVLRIKGNGAIRLNPDSFIAPTVKG